MEFSLPKNKGVKQEHTDYSAYGGESFLASASNSDELEGVKPRRGVRKSTKEGGNTLTIETSAPFDDGYQWRKYGTKEIRRSNYPRSYFRCTYRDDRNCAATKQVQQKNFTDPPVYEVTYRNSHSCNSTPMVDTKPTVDDQYGSGGMKRPNSISFDFSNCLMYHPDEHFSATNRLNTNQDQDSNFQFHEAIDRFTSDGYRAFDASYEADVYRELSSDYSSLQGLSELDGFGDIDLGEYVNSTDNMNSE